MCWIVDCYTREMNLLPFLRVALDNANCVDVDINRSWDPAIPQSVRGILPQLTLIRTNLSTMLGSFDHEGVRMNDDCIQSLITLVSKLSDEVNQKFCSQLARDQ